MPVKIIRQDITKLKVDAIVNATNPSLDATGGLDYYIHQLAGKELDEECRKIGKLKVGQACLTSGINCVSILFIRQVLYGIYKIRIMKLC